MGFSGEINSVTPTTIAVGSKIELIADWTAHTDSWWEWLNGWDTWVIINLNGYIGESAVHSIAYQYDRRIRETILVGPEVMPNRDLYGRVQVFCDVGGIGGGEGELVDEADITIKVKGEGVGINWIPILVLAGIGCGIILMAK